MARCDSLDGSSPVAVSSTPLTAGSKRRFAEVKGVYGLLQLIFIMLVHRDRWRSYPQKAMWETDAIILRVKTDYSLLQIEAKSSRPWQLLARP